MKYRDLPVTKAEKRKENLALERRRKIYDFETKNPGCAVALVAAAGALSGLLYAVHVYVPIV